VTISTISVSFFWIFVVVFDKTVLFWIKVTSGDQSSVDSEDSEDEEFELDSEDSTDTGFDWLGWVGGCSVVVEVCLWTVEQIIIRFYGVLLEIGYLRVD